MSRKSMKANAEKVLAPKPVPISLIQKQGEPPVPAEVIAQSIRKIAELGKQLDGSGLRQRAIVLLIADATGVNRSEITLILNALPELARRYCK